MNARLQIAAGKAMQSTETLQDARLQSGILPLPFVSSKAHGGTWRMNPIIQGNGKKVTCEFCKPPRTWWSERSWSKRRHVRKFHPEHYAEYRSPNEIGEVV